MCGTCQIRIRVLRDGAVGGEEDGHSAEINDKLYSTPAQGIAVAQRLGLGERGRYMAAFTFGNVHGAYKPGVVKLRPELLDEIQTTVALAIKAGEMPDPAHSLDVAPGKPFALVFHGGSGSAPEEIAQAVSYGVVKMNIDTDTQYAFSRAVAGHMFSNYDSVLKSMARWATRRCTTRVRGGAKRKAPWPHAWWRLAGSWQRGQGVEVV